MREVLNQLEEIEASEQVKKIVAEHYASNVTIIQNKFNQYISAQNIKECNFEMP